MNREQRQLEQLAADPSTLRFDDIAGADEGECRYCGCSEDDACIVFDSHDDPIEAGRPCSWHVAPDGCGFGVCSHPDCVAAYNEGTTT